MADITIEELSRQLAIQSKALKTLKAEAKSSATEVRLLQQTNESLKQRAAASHRPVAMWLNQGRDGKPDYYRIIFTDISSEMLFSLLKQGDFPEQFIDDAKRHLADLLPIPAKISCTVFANDFKRDGVDSDPDFHGRIFDTKKQ